ncbi:MAG: ATP-binding protein [Bullifex sp.]
MRKMDPHFVGRTKEIYELEKCYGSGRSEFVAVYGRRRVGKTFLVRSLFADQFSFYVSGMLNGSFREEIEVFSKALREYGYKDKMPDNWGEAFSCLDELIRSSAADKRCIVYIDEISSFDTPRSGFIKAIEHFWNVKGSMYDNLMLIISGSATHWIINKVINDRGGLHNRVTKQIHLRPFRLFETEEYGKKHNSPWDRLHYIQMYSAIGGVPYYWDKIDFTLSVEENMDNLFFSRDGELAAEYGNLYRSLFRNPGPYMAVIKALSVSRDGLTRKEISETVLMTSGAALTQILQDLENCDFIASYSNGSRVNGCIYRLIDFYSLFHHHFSSLMSKDGYWWRRNMLSSKVNVWYGLSFERICIYHADELVYALHLDSINKELYSWRSRNGQTGAQIDIVIDRADNMITLCEVKYSAGLFHLTKEEYLRIRNRIEAFRTEEHNKVRKGLQMVLVTTNGTSPSKYDSVFSKTLTADSLFVQI